MKIKHLNISKLLGGLLMLVSLNSFATDCESFYGICMEGPLERFILPSQVLMAGDSKGGLELLTNMYLEGDYGAATYIAWTAHFSIYEGASSDDEFIINWLKKGSKGDADAQFMLGIAYKNSWYGLSKDLEKAKSLFKDSWELGNPIGAYWLADSVITDENVFDKKIIEFHRHALWLGVKKGLTKSQYTYSIWLRMNKLPDGLAESCGWMVIAVGKKHTISPRSLKWFGENCKGEFLKQKIFLDFIERFRNLEYAALDDEYLKLKKYYDEKKLREK